MTHRQTLRELAFDTHGVVTVRDAEAAGVPAVEVRKLATRGALTRVGHGVYLMNEAPKDGLTEFAIAVALAGEDAVLADDAVLAAHDLAQVNLRRIRVATGDRVRKRLPPSVELVRLDVPAEDRDDIDGVPAMRLGTALLASRGRVMTSRLVDAARLAAARGLMDDAEAQSVIAELENA